MPLSNPEESVAEDYKELISSLPREKGWYTSYMYQHQGFWFKPGHIQALISCQRSFQVRDSDIFLITSPKSGTTWFKALIFTLLNRNRFPINAPNHPLLSHNPHDLIPFLEINLYADDRIPDIASIPSPRLFSTHLPYVSLPESVKNTAASKFVYFCRNPKDTFVSTWHFSNRLRLQLGMGTNSIGPMFEMFCKGISPFGPIWDHILEYWKLSKENPERVFFLKFEDMKEQPGLHLRRVAGFLGRPFSADEVELGLVEQILKLCSFDNLSSLEVNRVGKSISGVENTSYFRKGEVGDWKNYLSKEMVEKIDQITREKLSGSGLVL